MDDAVAWEAAEGAREKCRATMEPENLVYPVQCVANVVRFAAPQFRKRDDFSQV